MKPAHYLIIRYIADPGRSEALNIGIAAWDERGFRMHIDEVAAKRAIRDNPHLAEDAIDGLQAQIEQEFAQQGPFNAQVIERLSERYRGFPVLFSESRYTSVDDMQGGLDQTVERLVARIVHPRRRSDTGVADPLVVLRRSLKPLIAVHKLTQQYQFQRTRSGIPRQVHFYANHNVNVPVDAISMPTAKPGSILRAADAQAYKIEDIRDANRQVHEYIVYCTFSDKAPLVPANEHARRILESAGASVQEDAEQVTRHMERLVQTTS